MRPTESSLLSMNELNTTQQRKSRFGILNNLLGDGTNMSEANLIVDDNRRTQPLNFESMQLSYIEANANDTKQDVEL